MSVYVGLSLGTTALAGAMALGLQISPVSAAPIISYGVGTVNSTFTVNGGGDLPAGLDFDPDGPVIGFNVTSSLDDPTAVEFDDSDAVIAGADASNPSQFTGVSETTRAGGTEGARASRGLDLYQVVILDQDQDGDNDVAERSLVGDAIAQVGFLDDDALVLGTAGALVSSNREFLFQNNSNDAITFALNGFFSVSSSVNFEGGIGTANAMASTEFLFESDDPLDILYVPAGPFDPMEMIFGDNATSEILSDLDPATTGRFGLTSLSESVGTGALSGGISTSTLEHSFVLGITIQAGSEITFNHNTRYSSSVRYEPPGPDLAPVPLPAGLPLLVIGLGALGIAKRKSCMAKAG